MSIRERVESISARSWWLSVLFMAVAVPASVVLGQGEKTRPFPADAYTRDPGMPLGDKARVRCFSDGLMVVDDVADTVEVDTVGNVMYSSRVNVRHGTSTQISNGVMRASTAGLGCIIRWPLEKQGGILQNQSKQGKP